MIKKVFSVVLLIFVFLPSLVSAIPGLSPSYKAIPTYNSIDRAMQNDRIQKNADAIQQSFGRGGGGGGNSTTSAPTGPAQDADELVAQMNEELKLAKSYADAADRDLLKIKNRNSVENFQVSIFGGDPNLASSIQQNIDQSYYHFSQIYKLNSECNCIGSSGPIIKEADSIRTTFISKSSQAESERENKGIVGEIMKVISNSKTSSPDVKMNSVEQQLRFHF
jgi:hypothetical protein